MSEFPDAFRDEPFPANASRPPVPAPVHYVGFWKRVWASLIDIVWLVPLVLGLGFIFFGRSYFTVESTGYNGMADFLVTNVLPALAVLAFWVLRQATPGKILTGMKIVDAKTLGKPRLWQWILRYIGYIPATMLMGLGLIWVAIDRRHQGWHDKIAGTVVIYSDEV